MRARDAFDTSMLPEPPQPIAPARSKPAARPSQRDIHQRLRARSAPLARFNMSIPSDSTHVVRRIRAADPRESFPDVGRKLQASEWGVLTMTSTSSRLISTAHILIRATYHPNDSASGRIRGANRPRMVTKSSDHSFPSVHPAALMTMTPVRVDRTEVIGLESGRQRAFAHRRPAHSVGWFTTTDRSRATHSARRMGDRGR
jgi:hypothetical protein